MTLRESLIIAGMMVVTFGVRYPVLAFLGRMNLAPWVRRSLRFVPVAVLSAICAPIVFLQDGSWHLTVYNAALIGSVAAVVVAWRFGHLLLTICVGMLVFVAVKLLVNN